jgi:putative MATE family efflux protein
MQPIRRRILTLALPVILSSVLERMVQIVDIFLVGGLGANAIASVGLSQLLVFFFLNVLAGLTMGITIMVAQLWGAKRRREAADIATQSLRIGFLLAVIASLLGVTGGPFSAKALGATPDMLELMRGYLLIIFSLFTFTFIVDQLIAIMHGAGDTRTPMIAVTIVNVLHILIAYPLIYGHWGAPALGVNGAALAVGLSEAVGTAYLFAKARAAGYLLPLFDPALRRQPGGSLLSSWRQIVRVGLPITFDRLLQQTAQMAYAKIILGYGIVVYAAHQVGLSIEALSFMPGNGFAIAAGTAVGQSIGAHKLAKAKIENWEANRLAVLLMAGMGLLFFCFPYLMLRAFTTDDAVIGYGTLFLKIVGLLQIPLAITMVVSGSLKGAGDTRFLLKVTVVGAWLVRVPLAALFSGLGLTIGWVWTVMLLDWITRMGFVVWRYRSEQWQRSVVIDRSS